MPGIAGIVSKAPIEANEEKIKLMVSTMMHEPFYSSGTYSDKQMGVCAGWICHEGSFADCMPVWNEKRNMVLIFHGENFTDLELFDRLKACHHKFDRSNASYLIHMYEEYGIEFLKQLNGWFNGILIDLLNRKILLFNDRYGMQRIFYHEGKDAFYFASEAKALLKVCPDLREIDMRSLGEFLSCDCVLEYRTLFRNVCLLPGSSAWCFEKDGSIDKRTYFNPDVLENQAWLEKEFFYEKLKETFSKVLTRYFRSTQPIGISLTGGLDTRIIMANAELPEGKYPCYTFGGMYRDCTDVTVGRKVAAVCNQPHTTLPLGSEFLCNFSDYAEKTIYTTDGYLDVNRAPEIYLNKKARDVAAIRMNGNYGGEVLRGISGKLRASSKLAPFFNADFSKYFQEASVAVNETNNRAGDFRTFNLFKEIPWLRNHGFVAEQSQLIPRTPYMDNDLIALMYRAPMEARTTKELCFRLIADGNPELAKIPTDRGVGGHKKFPISAALRLYHGFCVKAEYAYDYGMPELLARIDRRLMFIRPERLFLGRHKFAHFRIWYRDVLSGYIKEILLDEKTLTRNYLNRKAVEEMVRSHTEGRNNFSIQLSKMLTLELTQRLLIENN
jgi:asparagine synthase (glutamine-hydrolysing)